MSTQQTQIARPTAAVQIPSQQVATPSGAVQQSKPAFVAPTPAPKPVVAAKPAPQAVAKPAAKIAPKVAPKAAAPAAKPAAKKAAPIAKKAATAKKTAVAKKAAPAAKKPVFKPAAKQPASNSNKPSAATSTAANATATIQNFAGKATEGLNEVIAAGKQNIQAVIECGNTATSISKSIGAEWNKLTSQAIAQNAQAVQKFLACRTATDWVNLSNSLIRSQIDGAYNSGLKIAELTAQFAKINEPLNARFATATQTLTKRFKQ